MKRWVKYMLAFSLTGLLAIALITNADAQHRGGGGGGFHGGGGGSHGGGGGGFHGGGGSFHSGGGGFHGNGGSVRGGSAFHGGGGFHGNAGVRGGVRGGSGFHGSGGFHGNAGVRGGSANRGSFGARSGMGYRGSVRGGVGVNSYRGGYRGYRGVYGNRGVYGYRGGYGSRGGYYHGGRYYGAYRGGFYRGHYYGYHGYYGPGFRFGFGWGYPHIGFYLGALPFGCYNFYWNSDPYYYNAGTFYRPYNGGYEVVVPPVGAAVPSLPGDAQPITIDGVLYYEYNGVYYQESQDEDGRRIYIVAGKDGVLNTDNGGGTVNDQPLTDNDDPIMDNSGTDNQADNTAYAPTVKVGDIVAQLPEDCRKVTLSSKKFYVSPDNIFYEEFKDADGTGYRVASVPGAND